jgi:glycosyltransferase involved in cell wall biosynthesis
MAQRILLLADISSSHTEKWALALAKKGFLVGLFSFNKTSQPWHSGTKNIVILNESESFFNSNSVFNKLKYTLVLPKLLRVIKEFKPDVLHAHYASSYGLLGALSQFKPFVISVWGSDVYEFPRKSFLHKFILKYNLKKADKILSTSYAMKGELWKYSSREVEVVPFGVDTTMFYPEAIKKSPQDQSIHIGTIKAIEDQYGIKTIIEAVNLVRLCLPKVPLKLSLVGAGSKTSHYKKMASSMDLDDIITFTGKIPFSKIAHYHNLLDILLNVSTVDESFGVSVIESMACEKAVIVSNAPGLMEVVEKNCGLIVEKENAQQLARAIMQLIESPQLRIKMGKNARQHVLNNYDFENCLLKMINVYDSLQSKKEEFVLNLNFKVKSSQT